MSVSITAGLPPRLAGSVILEVIGLAKTPSETRERVDLEKITTQIVGNYILCGNGQVWDVIGDA